MPVDPLSIYSILKDVIQVAQAIQTIVEKVRHRAPFLITDLSCLACQVTQNRKALQKLSAEVVRALLDLGKFYDERTHLLDDATELRDALDKLCTLVSKSAVHIESYAET